MKRSNYSLNHAPGPMDDSNFLAPCRALGLEKASLHAWNLVSTEAAYLKRVRDEYPDQGVLSASVREAGDRPFLRQAQAVTVFP